MNVFTYLRSFHQNLLLHKPRVIFYNDKLESSMIIIEHYFVRKNLVWIKSLDTNAKLTQSSLKMFIFSPKTVFEKGDADK